MKVKVKGKGCDTREHARPTLPVRHLGCAAGIKRVVILTFFLGSVLSLTACSTNKNEGRGQGIIYLTIFQPNTSLSFDHITFEVKLMQGSVRQSHDPLYDSQKSPTMITPRARTTNSPNGVYVAGAEAHFPQFYRSPYQVFFVRNLETGQLVFKSRFREREIQSIVWSSRSEAVAILTSSQHYSLSPKYWFQAISGHPKPFEKYRLEIVDPQTNSNWGIDIPYRSSAGYGEIRSWTEGALDKSEDHPG